MNTFHLSLGTTSIEDAVYFYTTVLPGKVTHNDDSGYVNVDLYGCQLTLKFCEKASQVSDFHFGFNLDMVEFNNLSENIVAYHEKFIEIPPKVIDRGQPLERKKLILKSPTGYFVELKGYTE